MERSLCRVQRSSGFAQRTGDARVSGPVLPQGVTRGRPGSLLDISAVTRRLIEDAIMGRNAGLPVSHLAEALLDVRPFEEPSAALSRVPVHGRTPVPLRAACMVALAGLGSSHE
jgi:hypothetical protein